MPPDPALDLAVTKGERPVVDRLAEWRAACADLDAKQQDYERAVARVAVLEHDLHIYSERRRVR